VRLKPSEGARLRAGSRLGGRGDLEALIVFVPLLTFDVRFDRCFIYRAHMCCPQYRFLSSGISVCKCRPDISLMYCAIFDRDKIGGADNNRCMWSGETAPRMVITCRASQIWRIRLRARSAIRPRGILYQYFVHQTTRYFQIEDRVCAMPVFRHPLIVEGVESAAGS
jgi:hypothetical protein